jgi:AraC-like DNA-binding protein
MKPVVIAPETVFTTRYSYFPVSQRDRRWGLYVTTAGESHIPAGLEYPPKGHPDAYHFDWQHGRSIDEFQLVHITRGSGTLETPARQRWRIEAGDVFLLFPGVWHRYRPYPGIGWDEHWVGFDGPIARNIVMTKFYSAKTPVLRIRSEDHIAIKFAELMDVIAQRRAALQQIMAGITFEILGRVYSTQQGGLGEMQRGSKAVQEALRLMNESRNGHLDMRRIARELHLSYSYLRRMFKQQTGLSPHQYWMDLKIARARTLLSDPVVSVKEVAHRTGFDSQQYFCRLFKDKLGCTPGDFRARRLRIK